MIPSVGLSHSFTFVTAPTDVKIKFTGIYPLTLIVSILFDVVCSFPNTERPTDDLADVRGPWGAIISAAQPRFPETLIHGDASPVQHVART
jgi:hypothetical protein